MGAVSAYLAQHGMVSRGLSPADCADKAKHNDKGELDILRWRDLAEKKSLTHKHAQCPTCGFWVIWAKP